ncbi:MAG TPA: TPM domain-containing protein [Candidatus Omnitrophota bacterium]|nr:TPM domain-containing protein [Candidatus Omnitrophota bacterium]
MNDYAGLLSGTAREKMDTVLANFDKETSSQIFVAIFPSLEGESLEDFSIRLFDKWKPGTKKNDNGILLVVFRDDRKIRIEVGYGLEGVLPDAIASQIIRDQITPAFREGNYERGVSGALQAIIQATKGEYKGSPNRGEDRLQRYSPLMFVVFVTYLLLPIVCYLLVLFIGVSLFGFPVGLVISAFLILLLAVVRMFF